MSDIHALSGAYAVDALDDDEREQFERHLATCETCTAEVASLQEAAAVLAETTVTAPSPDLRARVLAEIGTVRPLPPAVQPHDELAQRRRRRRLPTFLAAAAAVIAIGAGAVVVQQVTDDGATDRFSAVADAPDAHSYRVQVGDATAVMTVSKKRNEAYVQTTDMPPAPTDKQYVLWLQHGETLTQAGVMPAGEDNKVMLSGDAATANGAAISVEDDGPAPSEPSDDVVATFSFDA